MSADVAGGPPPGLIAALKRLLRPLVRGLIAHGLTYPQLIEILKSVYVDAAERELAAQGEKPTQSRVSVVTGVHRKDVRRLQDEAQDDEAAPAQLSLGARLAGIWAGDPRFLDEANAPLPLHRHRSDGSPSFEELVETVSKDVRPRAVLDEWLRLGVAQEGEDGLIRLNTLAFAPREGFEESAYYFGRNLRDHIATSTHNLLGEGAPLLEQAVFYDELTEASAAQLARLARELGLEALTKANREALRLSEEDAGKEGATHRMTFGVYFYQEDERAPDDSDGEG